MKRLTLGKVLGLATLALAITVIIAFGLVLTSAQRSILVSAQKVREQLASRVRARVDRELARAERVLDNVDHGILSGALPIDDAESVEAPLFQALSVDDHLEEVTITRGSVEDAPDGTTRLTDGPGQDPWQTSVFRGSGGSLTTRITKKRDGAFAVFARSRGPDGRFAEPPLTPAGAGTDPTAHATFSVLVERKNRDAALWSDLHFSEFDPPHLPVPDRRVVLSVQRAIKDQAGHVLGVMRVGILTRELDRITHEKVDEKVDETAAEDPHLVFLLSPTPDGQSAHLVARTCPTDHIAVLDDDVRVVTDSPPPELSALLASPLLGRADELDAAHPSAARILKVRGVPYFATLEKLTTSERGGTRDWLVAIVVPEAHYTHDLEVIKHVFVFGFAATALFIVVIGGFTIRAVRKDLGKIVKTTVRMRDFDFAPSQGRGTLGDLDEVIQGLERAKTVVRAMEKYVPLDLVRKLYASNREPALGGELAQLSMMFTDIRDFTVLSEHLAPDVLALRLGDYLEAMTVAIQETHGTIDKYIGDAVMALWNAPTPVARHAELACEAALLSIERTRALYASERWKGLPPLTTRYGLHTAQVMVGNFGAPTRLSYTALGDGVNLAARLEPLCKQYGVLLLASETIVEGAKDAFVFRRVDRVAVKGKSWAIDVFELVGRKADAIAPSEAAVHRRYEEAFACYLARDFTRACELCASQKEDGPSAVLRARCEEFMKDPPPSDWGGVHVASSK